MLTMIDFKNLGGRYSLSYEFENWFDEKKKGLFISDSETECYKHYFGVCHSYSLQCADKIRFAAKYYENPLPKWIFNLLDYDPTVMAMRLKGKLNQLYFKDEYVMQKVKFFAWALSEQRAIIKKLNE